MTDYKEEQNNEVEALESIYPDEFELISSDPVHKFTILVKSSDYTSPEDDASADNSDDEEEREITIDPDKGACFTLEFEYTSQYPDSPPVMEIQQQENLLQQDLPALRTCMEEQLSECAGMAMVFTIVSAAQEWLNTFVEERQRLKEQEEEEQKLKEEEEAQKVFEGTRVSVETFMSWKAKFDAEMSALRGTKDRDDGAPKRLTGRELFVNDKTMNDSDLSFLGEADGQVAVDESLFEDLDDLDLEDDPDYVPGDSD